MVFYMIGLGLNDEKDISVNGLDAIKKCKKVFLEDYTSRLNVGIDKLENFYGKKLITANRDMVEKKSDILLEYAKHDDVAFLVVGDVFSATTHIDLYLRAKEKGIKIIIINNTSILNAVGIVGLELYKYGKTTSMPYFEPSFRPATPYEVIMDNKKHGLHTLVLLDIKQDQDRFMTVNEAISQFFEIENEKKENFFTPETMIVGCARLGSSEPCIRFGNAGDLEKADFGDPLHCLIVPGKLHFMEEDMLKLWR